jgi:hypothetical protein
MIGTIRRIPLREVWKHEALDFTTWLEGNVSKLADLLGVPLSNIEREQDAGDFSVDLVAQNDLGEAVVIENQLGRSDHDHLGKLLTYLAALDAKAAVWIVAEPRPEHVRAVGWLNESGLAKFYIVKLEAIKIDDSSPAPLFTLITGPSEETTRAGDKRKELAYRNDPRYRFWEGLLERAKQTTRLHANISPSTQHWVGTSAGRNGLKLNYVILKDSARVELYIYVDGQSGEDNKAMFDGLAAHKDAIEQEFGASLRWERLDDSLACRISAPVERGGLVNMDEWPEIQEAMIDSMIRFERVFRPQWEKL